MKNIKALKVFIEFLDEKGVPQVNATFDSRTQVCATNGPGFWPADLKTVEQIVSLIKENDRYKGTPQ